MNPSGARYEVRWSALDNQAGTQQAVRSPIALAERRVTVPAGAWGPRDDAGFRHAVAAIATLEPAHPRWVAPVTVTIRERAGALEVVGIER